MRKKKMPHITPAELDVMKVIWEARSATVQQALDALSAETGETPAYTTIMTMMKNLAEKGALRVDRERQPFVYTPAIRKENVLRERLTEFVQTVFDGKVEDLILHLAEETALSPGDLRRIQEKIRKREPAKTPRSRSRGEEGGT